MLWMMSLKPHTLIIWYAFSYLKAHILSGSCPFLPEHCL